MVNPTTLAVLHQVHPSVHYTHVTHKNPIVHQPLVLIGLIAALAPLVSDLNGESDHVGRVASGSPLGTLYSRDPQKPDRASAPRPYRADRSPRPPGPRRNGVLEVHPSR